VESFSSVGPRDDHIAIVHPIERPVLFIHGEPASSSVNLHQLFTPDNISFANCIDVSVYVDGSTATSLSPRDFANRLASQPAGYYKATLRNDRAQASYVVRVAIPTERELLIIEDLFSKFLGFHDVTVSGIRRFSEEAAALDLSRDYADALANYILGILAKDQAGGTAIPLERFSDKLRDSLEVLKDFERPLARFLTACIRLNLNDFGGPSFTSGNTVLDDGFRFFQERTRSALLPAVRGTGIKKGRTRPCPIDSSSEVILSSCANLSACRIIDHERLNSLIVRGATTELDRAKVRVILVVGYLAMGDLEEAGRCLRLLTNDEIFGHWANRMMKELGQR